MSADEHGFIAPFTFKKCLSSSLEDCSFRHRRQGEVLEDLEKHPSPPAFGPRSTILSRPPRGGGGGWEGEEDAAVEVGMPLRVLGLRLISGAP